MNHERPLILVSNMFPGCVSPKFDAWIAEKVLKADGVEAFPKRYKHFSITPGVKSLHASYLSESSLSEVFESAREVSGVDQKLLKLMVAGFSYFSLHNRFDLEGFTNLKKLSESALPIVAYWSQFSAARAMFPEVNIQIAPDMTRHVGETTEAVSEFLLQQEVRGVYGCWDTYHSTKTQISLDGLVVRNVKIPEVHIGVSRADTGKLGFDIQKIREEVEMIPHKKRIVLEGYNISALRRMVQQVRTWNLMA